MSAGRRNQKYRREPLDEATSTQVPGENRHRPRDVAWFGVDYDAGCDCEWNWGDGPESIDGSPREMYWYPNVRPLNRIQDRADYILEFDARRARNKHVSAITQQLESIPEASIDWKIQIEKVCRILSQPAPETDDRLDELLEDILSFVQNAPRQEWQAFLSSMGDLHPDYIPVLPWFRLRESRRPLPRHEKGVAPHLIREWAHRLVGSELILHVFANNFADRKEISAILNSIRPLHYYWHDKVANAFSHGAATLRSIDYPTFHMTIAKRSEKRTFQARPVSKTEIFTPSFGIDGLFVGRDALFAPEVVHYRFFEDDRALYGHLTLCEAIFIENVDIPSYLPCLVVLSFHAPRRLFRCQEVDDLLRILHALAISRGIRSLYLANRPQWEPNSRTPFLSFPRPTAKEVVFWRVDSIAEHSHPTIGSVSYHFGAEGVEVPSPEPGTACLLPENETEVLRLRALVPRTPIQLGPVKDYRYGFISDFPRIK